MYLMFVVHVSQKKIRAMGMCDVMWYDMSFATRWLPANIICMYEMK